MGKIVSGFFMSENFTLDSFVNLHKDEVKEILSLPDEPTPLDAAELMVDHEIEDYLDGQNPHLQDLADEYGAELKNVLIAALTESLTEAEVAPVSYQDFMIDGHNGVLMVFEDETAVGIADIDGNVRYYEGNIQNEEFYTTAEFEDYQSILNKLPEDYKNEWREFATEYSQKITDKLGDSIMRESQEENNMLSNPNVEDVVRHIYANRSNYGDDYEFLSPDEVARLAEELGIENLTHNEIAAISYEMDKLAEELDLSNEPEQVTIDIDAKDFVVGDENMEDQNINNDEDIEDVEDFEESLLKRFNATRNTLVEQYQPKQPLKIRKCNNLAERHKLAESLFKESGRVPISRKALKNRLQENVFLNQIESILQPVTDDGWGLKITNNGSGESTTDITLTYDQLMKIKKSLSFGFKGFKESKYSNKRIVESND